MKRLLTGLFVWLAAITAAQAATEFKGVRLWAAPDHTRVVFDTSGPVSHELFALENPDRLVIDVKAAAAADTLKTAAKAGGLLFFSGMMPFDENGLAQAAKLHPAVPYYGQSIKLQMAYTIEKVKANHR